MEKNQNSTDTNTQHSASESNQSSAMKRGNETTKKSVKKKWVPTYSYLLAFSQFPCKFSDFAGGNVWSLLLFALGVSDHFGLCAASCSAMR